MRVLRESNAALLALHCAVDRARERERKEGGVADGRAKTGAVKCGKCERGETHNMCWGRPSRDVVMSSPFSPSLLLQVCLS